MCNHVILSAVKRSTFDPLRSVSKLHEVEGPRGINEDLPSGCLDLTGHYKQITVAE
jgi:hypothetical protein